MKYDRERRALQRVYREEQFESVRHADSPDFVLQRRGHEPFGVEVTDLYPHEADARMDAHPEYVRHLLAGGRHMHRDDVEVLGVTTVEIHDKDGKLKARGVPAILRPNPAPELRAAALANVVDRKSERYGLYEQGLTHVNLIVVDHFEGRRLPEEEYNVAELLPPGLRRALTESRFREVFLAAEQLDGWVVRPLQMLRLLEAFYLFLGALESYDETPDDLGHEEVAPLFVHACRDRDLDLYFSSGDGDRPCAVHRGAGVRHTGDDISILDFHDFPPPASTTPPPARFAPDMMRHFGAHLDTFLEQNRFTTGLFMPDATPLARTGGAPGLHSPVEP